MNTITVIPPTVQWVVFRLEGVTFRVACASTDHAEQVVTAIEDAELDALGLQVLDA